MQEHESGGCQEGRAAKTGGGGEVRMMDEGGERERATEKDRRGSGRESKHVRGRRSSQRCTEEVVLKLEGAAGKRRTC